MALTTSLVGTCIYAVRYVNLVLLNSTLSSCAVHRLQYNHETYNKKLDVRQCTFSGIGDHAIHYYLRSSSYYASMVRINENTFIDSPAARRVLALTMATYSLSNPRTYQVMKNKVDNFKCLDPTACIYVYVYHTSYSGSTSYRSTQGLRFDQNEIENSEGT